jgi:hypothetical protein
MPKEGAMSSRNSDKSSKKAVRKPALKAVREVIEVTPDQSAGSEQKSAPVPEIHREEALDTEVELDRGEIYFRGPTAFTA